MKGSPIANSDLTLQKCVPCECDIPPLIDDEIHTLQKETHDWEMVEVEGVKRLKRDFEFDDYAQALSFTNKVGEAVEEQDITR